MWCGHDNFTVVGEVCVVWPLTSRQNIRPPTSTGPSPKSGGGFRGTTRSESTSNGGGGRATRLPPTKPSAGDRSRPACRGQRGCSRRIGHA